MADAIRLSESKVGAIINTSSGGFDSESAHKMFCILQRAGIVEPRVWCGSADEMTRSFVEATEQSLDVLIVLGGDGTIRTAAEACAGKGPYLIPLPGGTMNMLSRALYGDVAWEESLENTLTAPSLKVLSGGRIAGKQFLIAAIVGAPALWAEPRESIREGNIVDAIEKGSVAFRNMFEAKVQYLISDGMKGEAKAVALICPVISKEMSDSEQAFEAAIIDVDSAAAVVRLATTAAFGKWRDDRNILLTKTKRRRLRVSKLRAVKFREGYHDYIIATGGLRVFPRMIAAEHRSHFRHEPVSSGIKELDTLCGGGLDRGTTTLILGPVGTGKSTLALQYAARMADQGERCMIFTFDETRSVMLGRAKALGFKLEKAIESGTITVQQVDPAELSPGEFAVRILDGVKAGCKFVAIDSLNGYLNAMPGEKYLNNQLHELCSYLNQQGVVTVLVLAQHGLATAAEAPVDLSYLSDTVVSLRYFEAYGEVKQAIAVVKKRSGAHEKTIREFKLMSGKGIVIGEPLTQFQGVLTGVPIFRGSEKQIIKGR